MRPRPQDAESSGGKRPGQRRPFDPVPGPEAGSFGVWLRRQREMREISLREIAEKTKISLRYLEAMEDDRFDVLPATVFAKGFLREYARYVGLSPDEVVNHYLSVQQSKDGLAEEEPGSGPAAEGRPARRWGSWRYGLLLALAGLAILGLIALAAHFAERRRANPSSAAPPPIAAPPAPRPSAAPAAAPAEEPGAPLHLTLDFTANCWVDAVIDGGRRLSELRVQGESLQIDARETVDLTLGNAGAVEAQLNGNPLPVPGGDGAVGHLTIDLATLAALREKKEPR